MFQVQLFFALESCSLFEILTAGSITIDTLLIIQTK